jgi:hypothetical protein
MPMKKFLNEKITIAIANDILIIQCQELGWCELGGFSKDDHPETLCTGSFLNELEKSCL